MLTLIRGRTTVRPARHIPRADIPKQGTLRVGILRAGIRSRRIEDRSKARTAAAPATRGRQATAAA